MLLLLSCWIIAGITAEDPPKRHYRVKNDSLCLHVGHPPPYRQHTWLCNENVIVLGENVTTKYIGKVDYNPRDHSLCINKLTETDNGIYKFTFINSDLKFSKETHSLIVEEPVPTPVMSMSGLHSNLSVGLCNITVNCSIQDDWVWSFCGADSCKTSQESLQKVNITIFTDSSSVVCSGNNHVMASNVSESIEAMCFRQSSPEQEEASETPIVIVIPIAVAVCASLIAFALCVARSRISARCNRLQNYSQTETPTARITEMQPAQEQPQSVQRASTSSSSQAEACYENMDAAQPCHTGSPTISTREDSESQKVDTVYSLVQAPNVTSSRGKSHSSEDTQGSKALQDASASRCATLDEAERPDTLYSVLQKPITEE